MPDTQTPAASQTPPAPQAPASKSIIPLFEFVRNKGGSDLHIAAGSTPKIRYLREIYEIPNHPPLTEDETLSMIYETMDEETKEKFIQNMDADFSFHDTKGQRYRCNALQTLHGPAAVFRIISNKVLSFDELRLPESVKKIDQFKKGIILVTGPSGCGKSTTLATLVDMINTTHDDHIITIEDPVEILHQSKKSLVNHREVGTHTKSFARALKSALREDPDTIMIGEMRDLETISEALTAAETGHLVFGTLHTSSAAKTISRIVDVFPFQEQGQVRAMLGEAIQCVISQVLCKRKDGQGLVAAFEIMFANDGIRNLIRTNKIYQIPSSIETGVRDGMQLLDVSLKELVQSDIITKEEAMRYASHPEDFKAL